MTPSLALISDPSLYDAVSRQISTLAVEFACAFEAPDFWDMLAKRPYGVLIAELRALGASTTTFLEKIRRVHPTATVVLLGSTTDPVRSSDRTRLLSLPLAEGALSRVICHAAAAPPVLDPLDEIVGSSPNIRAVKERVRLFAASDATVLVLGPSGSGKEMTARAIHALGARRDGPFVPLNCGAIPSEIIESELFGHVKGAFTGAERDRAGHFELADGGVLFLDEIGTMRLDHQVRLLRVLQERHVTPIGSTSRRPVDVRVIAATNSDLPTLIEDGRFREDLFYRLNVLLITLPSLRERREDIPMLARTFADQYARRTGSRAKAISDEAMERLCVHPWKGNIRELENAIEHAMVLSEGREVIEPLDLPGMIGDRRAGVNRSLVRLTPQGLDLNETVSRIERDMILQSLAIASGNKSKAAELLHLKRTTFVEKMRRLDLLEADDSPSAE